MGRKKGETWKLEVAGGGRKVNGESAAMRPGGGIWVRRSSDEARPLFEDTLVEASKIHRQGPAGGSSSATASGPGHLCRTVYGSDPKSQWAAGYR